MTTPTQQLSFNFDAPSRPPDAQAAETVRRLRGRMAQLSGVAAEYSVASNYERRGFRVMHQRWRGKSGEIDLILSGPDRIVFVEVKKSRSFERAAEALSARQLARLYCAAEEFAGTLPTGSLTNMQLDVALLNQHGEMRILENACA